MNLDEAVILRTYASETFASIAAARLGSGGIEAHIQKDDCGGAYPSLQISGGVRLLVKPEDLEDAQKILNEMEAEGSGVFDQQDQEEQPEDCQRTKSSRKPFEVLAMKDLPSQQLDELKTVLFTYVVMAPLISALFADKIDNIFVACLLFVGLVGTFFVYLRNRLGRLEGLLKEQERRLMELEGVRDEEFE
ncbi:MAG: DUF2007 domain-containing protein [Desulfomonile tiedjei]|uniref:DUF2007 domain-containing protein n=1 Tax=Desulfomonile tiedjei TaxID=2358 RepID=A0A9D6UZ47_9BACT|nr:DUF2007 domain-containing protein [Desulfomonile tiedjei]